MRVLYASASCDESAPNAVSLGGVAAEAGCADTHKSHTADAAIEAVENFFIGGD